MDTVYELALLGVPSAEQISEIESHIAAAVESFGMQLGKEVSWDVRTDTFNPAQQRGAAAAYFAGENASQAALPSLLQNSIPILPVVTDIGRAQIDLPPSLRQFNWLDYYNCGGADRVATALLECAGLLPRQRCVFISYRRDEARQAALQLFDALSARLFDVFLDTHGIAPGDDFQAMLWHRLCDSDVLVMLDTPNYFESRWTAAEFGRALAKGISVLRVGWPDCTPSIRTATASRAEIVANEVDHNTGRLNDETIERICTQLERVRSQSHAVRNLNLVSSLRQAIERIGGEVIGVGLGNSVHIRLADGTSVIAYPTVRVPTSTTLHDAATSSPEQSVAVVYDHIGLDAKWLEHLEWLGSHIPAVRWVRASEAAWQFADWSTEP